MLLIFPLIYIISFLLAIWGIYKKIGEAAFIYVIIGLPIYNTSFSILYIYRLKDWIPVLQSLKELLILSTLLMLIWNYRKRLIFHTLDYWVLAFLLYTSFYTLIPIGHFSILQKLLALKGLSFFTVIYFTGRLIDIDKIYISQIFYWVGIVAIAAACFQLYEVITDTHFQTFSGYSVYNEEFYGEASSGHYGLSWTFERDNGVKRFASFFSNPLDLANSTLVTTAMILAMYTDKKNTLRLNKYGWIVAVSALFAVIFAISRASLAAYAIIIYCYAVITKRKEIQYVIYSLIVAAILYLFYLMKDKTLYDYIISTIQLSDSSSIGHLLEWIEGTQTIISNPIGIGLGESGKVSSVLQENIGGENQFIIVGVQTGVISLFIYITIYILVIRYSWNWYPLLTGKAKTLALSLFLIKIAFIFPLFTSNFDANSYIVYLTWLLTGILISMIQKVDPVKI